MSTKKSQITLVVIFGVLILLIVVMLFYFKSSLYKQGAGLEVSKETQSQFKVDQVKVYVESCVEEVGKNGINFISQRGGYFDLPNNYFKAYPTTAYYLFNNKKVSPSTEEVEKELSKYITSQLIFCTNKLAIQDIDISFGKPRVTSTIKEKSIDITVKIDTEIRKDSSVFKIKDYSATINSDRLQKAYSVANSLVDQVLKDQKTLCFTCIFKEANKQGFNVVIDTYNDTTYIIKLVDFTEPEKRYQLNFVINI